MPLSAELLTILLLGASALLVVICVWLLVLSLRMRALTRGKSGASLEDAITALHEHARVTDEFMRSTESALSSLDARIKKTAVTPQVARFDAFSGMGEGGRQSFAVALVSEEGDGMVLSSLYTRDRMRVYAKPVSGYGSSHELTDEEREVLLSMKKGLAKS